MRSLLIILSLIGTGVADAQTSGEPASTAPTDEKPVCRRLAETGTHFTKRVCKPAAVWREQDRDTSDNNGLSSRGDPRGQGTSLFGPEARSPSPRG